MYKTKYEPRVWQNFLNATCYSYVLNQLTNERYYVGDIFPSKRADKYCDDIELINILKNEIKYLGFDIKESSLTSTVDEGETKIYMVRSLELGYYHFFRMDEDGLWSHKRPKELPNRIGYDGNLITNNPQLAAEPGYDKGFCFNITKL